MQGHEPHPSTPEQMRDYTQRELVKWAKIIKAAGVKTDGLAYGTKLLLKRKVCAKVPFFCSGGMGSIRSLLIVVARHASLR